MGARNDQIVIPITATLGRDYHDPMENNGKRVFATLFNIESEKVELFYRSIGEKPQEVVPWSYTMSLAISALLKMSASEDGEPSGINRGMGFNFVERPHVGNVQVDIFLAEKPKPYSRLKKWGYQFLSYCRQDGRLLAYGNIDVLADKELKLSRSINF